MPDRAFIVFGLIFLMSAAANAQPYTGNQNTPPAPPPQSLDLYCRHDAAARTGYITPDQAARQTQANGAIGGLLGGAAIGAILGGHHAGTGAAIGAGAGLLAGSVIGANNAQHVANDVERHYDEAYYDCMDANQMAPLYYTPDPNGEPPPPPPRGQY